MPKLFADRNCIGADLANGRRYTADRSGFINVSNPGDVKELVKGGYVVAGGMPRLQKYYVCECGWEASIRHCPKCDRSDLIKIER